MKGRLFIGPPQIPTTFTLPDGRVLTSDSSPTPTPTPQDRDQDRDPSATSDFFPSTSNVVFKDVDDAIRYNYYNKQSHNSTICDMLALYLKGQKILYTEAKTHCEMKLNLLMLPSIFITSACSILGPVLKDTQNGITAISGLSGLTAFILAVITYLKLDAKAEAHRTSAYKFDKLQSYVEFNSGKVLFLDHFSENVETIILEVEKSVREIKETNPFVLPEQIRYDFARLYGTNVFAEIKRIQNFEMSMVNKLKDVYNSINDVECRLKVRITSEDTKLYDKLQDKKKELIDKVLRIREEYHSIDTAFEQEIRQYFNSCNRRYQICGWFNS